MTSALALVAMSGTAFASPVNPTVIATGFYDPASASLPNNVDFNAPGIPITAGTGDGSIAPVGAFNTAIAAAFAAGRGGVVDFDSLALDTLYFGMNASYAGGSKTLAITTNNAFVTDTGVLEADGAPTSGTQYGEDESATPYIFTFGSITGASVGETGVVAAGITILSGDSPPGTAFNFGAVTVKATFSDNSTFSATRTIDDLKGTGDTFYSAVAPAGLTITSLTISSTDSALLVPEFDDLAFATSVLPEPASLALLGLCLPMLLGRTRRSR
jgi:hypothetical protein